MAHNLSLGSMRSPLELTNQDRHGAGKSSPYSQKRIQYLVFHGSVPRWRGLAEIVCSQWESVPDALGSAKKCPHSNDECGMAGIDTWL